MHDLIVASTTIRRDAAGSYCINDLHRAAGGEKRHQPNHWLMLKRTQGLIAALDSTPGITGVPKNQAVVTVNGGAQPGTYVVEELVYDYAMWISPDFNIKVIRAAREQMTQARPASLVDMRDPRQLTAAFLQIGEMNRELQAKVDVLEPKALAHDGMFRLEGLYNLQTAARCLGYGTNGTKIKDFILKLHELRWTHKQNGTWQPHADKQRAGLMATKSITIEYPNGDTALRPQAMITPKGLQTLSLALARPLLQGWDSPRPDTPAH